MFKALVDLLIKEKIGEESFNSLGNILYPTKELIIKVNNFLISYFRGKNNQIDKGQILEGNLDYILYHIQYKVKDSPNKEETILLKTAYIMSYLFTSHSFTDGNKRTGFVIAMLFFTLNLPHKSPRVIIDYKNNSEYFQKIASGKTNDKKSISDLVQWLKTNI